MKSDKTESLELEAYYLERLQDVLPLSEAIHVAQCLTVLEPIPLTAPILELGCRDGAFCSWLTKKRVLIDAGIEENPLLLKQARRSGLYKELIRGNYSDLPWPTDSFSTCLSFSPLTTPSNDPILMTEIYRILKPGGHFVGLYPFSRKQGMSLRWLRCFLYSLTRSGKIKLLPKEEAIHQFISNAGLTVSRSIPFGNSSINRLMILSGFQYSKSLFYRKITGHYIPFPFFHRLFIKPINRKLLSLFTTESFQADHLLVIARKPTL